MAGKLNCPALTVLIPLEKDDPTAWRKNGPALLGILNPASADPATSWRKTESRQIAERLDDTDRNPPTVRLRTLGLRSDDPSGVERPLAAENRPRRRFQIAGTTNFRNRSTGRRVTE